MNNIFFLLLLFFFISIKCQSNGFPSCDEQLANTGFSFPVCAPDRNCYIYAVTNGFSQALNFTTILQCGTVNSTLQFTNLSAFSTSDRVCHQPATGFIANRECSLILESIIPCGENPDLETTTISLYQDTCGSITQDDDDDNCSSKCDCKVYDPVCIINSGCWWHSALIIFLIAAALFLIWAFALLAFFVLPRQTEKRSIMKQKFQHSDKFREELHKISDISAEFKKYSSNKNVPYKRKKKKNKKYASDIININNNDEEIKTYFLPKNNLTNRR